MRILLPGAIVIVLWFILSCNKEASLNGQVTLQGHLYIVDPNGTGLPTPAPGQKIYLNDKPDTPAYIFATVTDSLGQYAIPSLKKNDHYILFGRWTRNNITYAGAVAVNPALNKETISQDLIANPDYVNGIALTFLDPSGDAISKQPFRIYTSSIFAAYDSTKYAFVDSSTDIYGHFDMFNILAGTYYYVAIDTVTETPPYAIKASGQITVKNTGITPMPITLQ